MMGADGQTFQPMERPDSNGEGEASLSRGLSGVMTTIVKLTAITIIVLLVQKVFKTVGNRKMKFAAQETE